MKVFPVLACAVVVSSCASTVEIAPAGVFDVPDAKYSVTLTEDWSYFPPNYVNDSVGGLLTMDGPVLNRIILATLEPGDSFVEARKSDDVPIYKDAFSNIEQIEFLTASLTRMGYEAVEASKVDSLTIDGREGVVVRISGKLQSGLNVQGDIAMVKLGEDLNIFAFFAPSVHYYSSLSEQVSEMMRTIDFVEE